MITASSNNKFKLYSTLEPVTLCEGKCKLCSINYTVKTKCKHGTTCNIYWLCKQMILKCQEVEFTNDILKSYIFQHVSIFTLLKNTSGRCRSCFANNSSTLAMYLLLLECLAFVSWSHIWSLKHTPGLIMIIVY